MPRKKKLDLGLEITVRHPESEDWGRIPNPPTYEEERLDRQGRLIAYEMVPMSGQALLWLTLRRGMDPGATADLLRQLADLIDRHGAKLLSMHRGGAGSVSREGELVDAPLQVQYDENGDAIIPEVLSPRVE
jgi:hypothetical protein